MWIRSQSGTDLIYAKHFYVRGKNLYAGITLVGVFATEEDAMTVLDMIAENTENGVKGVFHIPRRRAL